MKLLIDIGNTRSKFIICDKAQLSAISIVETALISEQWLLSFNPKVTQCVISNVNHDGITDTIKQICEHNNIAFLSIKTQAEKFGVKCAYDKPSRFGVDRWLTLIAAKKLYPNQANLIIDAGTATTIDLVSRDGQHHGGWILPGIDLMFTSVVKNTQKVFATVNAIDEFSFANNTSQAVNQASWVATVGSIHMAIKCAYKEHLEPNEALNIIFTGGNAIRLSRLFSLKSELIENLLFIGMHYYHAEISS